MREAAEDVEEPGSEGEPTDTRKTPPARAWLLAVLASAFLALAYLLSASYAYFHSGTVRHSWNLDLEELPLVVTLGPIELPAGGSAHQIAVRGTLPRGRCFIRCSLLDQEMAFIFSFLLPLDHTSMIHRDVPDGGAPFADDFLFYLRESGNYHLQVEFFVPTRYGSYPRSMTIALREEVVPGRYLTLAALLQAGLTFLLAWAHRRRAKQASRSKVGEAGG